MVFVRFLKKHTQNAFFYEKQEKNKYMFAYKIIEIFESQFSFRYSGHFVIQFTTSQSNLHYNSCNFTKQVAGLISASLHL